MRRKMQHLSLASTLALSNGCALAAAPVDLVLDPKPQSTWNSCQSWGIAFAAATVSGTPFPSRNATELRKTEQALVRVRDAMAKATGADRTNHHLWRKLVQEASGGKLDLKVQYEPDLVKYFDRVRALTGVNPDVLGPTLSAVTVKTVVLSSFKRVGKDTYGSGHVVPILGVAPANSSPVKLALLNPGIRLGAKPVQLTCEFEPVAGDQAYTAQYQVQGDYELTAFDKLGYAIITVVAK